MKIIVPMAGKGKRMRPHTLTTPKPLIPIAGKPIVQRLVEDIAAMSKEQIDEVAFIIGDFGKEVEQQLEKIAKNIGAGCSIYYQDEALGTAHAIQCAEPSLTGHLVVAFADTLFQANLSLDVEQDGFLWTKQVDDPSSFGVVVTDENGIITRFAEKPAEFVSDNAIIGIYYFKDGDMLRDEIQYLLDNNIKGLGEFQLTDALENMKSKGLKFKSLPVERWMDCGNKNATVDTNKQILETNSKAATVSNKALIKESTIIEPCFIAPNAKITRSIIGPFVSVSEGTEISGSVISNSIIMENSKLQNICVSNSMIGSFVEFKKEPADTSIGDYTTYYD